MRHCALVLPLLLALPILAVPAAADSWMAPIPKLVASEDGRWYAIVEPHESWGEARFQLVRRAKGKPPREAPSRSRGTSDDAVRLEPESGDVVVAKGDAGFMPMEVRCLDGGKGFVLFETYANIGYQTVLQRHDAQGKVLWKRSLGDLFRPEQIERFLHTVSSIWWYEGVWIDEEAGDVVIAHKGEAGRGVVRVALATGKHRAGKPTDLLRQIGRGSAQERIEALASASEWKLDGLLEVVQAAFAKTTTPALARLHFAVHLQAAGDEGGKEFAVACARSDNPPDVRCFAVQNLSRFLPAAEAMPHFVDAMRAKDDAVWRAAEEALRGLGAAAVGTLAAMILDEKESERYRAGAATALWNMGAPAAPALPALEKAAKCGLPTVEYAAKHAIEHIRERAR